MTKPAKQSMLVSFAVCVVLAILFGPGMPLSTRFHQTLHRFRTKANWKLAAIRGEHPRMISISGTLTAGDGKRTLTGARIGALESVSGYFAMSDTEGRFLLPHLIWFPGASYTLVIAPDSLQIAQMDVQIRDHDVKDVFDIGELHFEDARRFERDNIFVRRMTYDTANAGYYKDLFIRLTAKCKSDEAKLDALNRFVATKLNYEETAREFRSPREILQRGSCYCSNLALALAALSESGGYPTRTVHLSDGAECKSTHVAVEIFYEDHWHLFDPTYGVCFRNEQGEVASYMELRLNPLLVTPLAFQRLSPESSRAVLEWMPRTLGSGLHQIYQVESGEFCAVW